jgi:glutaminyl-peptide cyclotransferase
MDIMTHVQTQSPPPAAGPRANPLFGIGLAMLAGLVVVAGLFVLLAPPKAPKGLQHLKAVVVRSAPHDSSAFTEGLVFYLVGLYESTGLEGKSTMRLSDYQTGFIYRRLDMAPDIFGEGLAMVEGEGWGLCYDETKKHLVMSNGSPVLTFRDPETFKATGQVTVTMEGKPVVNLNELECVRGVVYANVWQTDQIVVIDPGSGEVMAEIDASGLLTPEERAKADVLNGIAYMPQRDAFYVTGKLWPKLFEVKFLPREAAAVTAAASTAAAGAAGAGAAGAGAAMSGTAGSAAGAGAGTAGGSATP